MHTTEATQSSVQLTTASSVQDYLSKTPFASTHVDVLSGGNGNFMYRTHLKIPYRGDRETCVVKHAQPYVKVSPNMAFDLQRQVFEVEAMRRIRSWIEEGKSTQSLVTVPEIYSFDHESHVIIMEDCGVDLLTLKDFLLSDSSVITASTLASEIGSRLGIFIARMHQWSRSNPAGILNFFSENQLAKTLSAWVTHGRVLETLNGTAKLSKLEDPLLEVAAEDLTTVGELADEMQKKIKLAHEVFVMGDFYPGNVIVALDKDSQEPKIKQIYIFDWELSKPGVPGVELGQFCAEMIQLQHFASNPQRVKPIAQLSSDFISSYASTLRGAGGYNGKELVHDTFAHCGSHLITWTPRVSTWEDKETCRKTVLEGVELMINASKDDEECYRNSFAGALL